LLGATLEDALDAGLRKAGVFCSLCGRSAPTPPEPPRIDEVVEGAEVSATFEIAGEPTMTEYLVIDAEISPEPGRKPTVALARFYHCGREDCDATDLRAQAQAARRVPAWEVLANTPDAPPPEATEPKFEVGAYVIPLGSTHSPPSQVEARRWYEPDEYGRAGWRYDLTLDGKPVAPVPFQEDILTLAEGSR